MKAISLWQPWAHLVVLGLKRWETRSWSTSYRGPLLIHAAGRRDVTQLYGGDLLRSRFASELASRGWDIDCLPRRCVVGLVTLETVVRTETLIEPRGQLEEFEILAGNFALSRFAWKLSDPFRFSKVHPCRGHQRLFDVPIADDAARA